MATAAAEETKARTDAETHTQQDVVKAINAALRHSNENDNVMKDELGKETEARKASISEVATASFSKALGLPASPECGRAPLPGPVLC